VEVNGTALLGEFPADYFANASSIFDTTCGVPPSTPFGPQNTYFSTPIANVQRVYEGAQLNGYFTLGGLTVVPFYNTQVAKAISDDPRFDNPYAITISGNQLPGVPLHRAGVTAWYKAPRSSLMYMAQAVYTGGNNNQNLPAYTLVSAGVVSALKRGELSFTASNIFNTYGGIFATPENAVPYTTASGALIPTIARPNTPRQFAVTYTARFGQGAPPITPGATEGGPGGPGGGRRGGFGRFMQPLPETPPADPFALNASPMCTADAQTNAKALLGGLKAYAAQIQAAKTPNGYPATMPPANIPGVSVTYHGLGSTYALTIALKQTSEMRSLFGCTAFHVADEQTAKQHNLYVQPQSGGGMFFRPEISFMPSVGLYFVRRPPQAGQQSFRLYQLPATAPKTPFELHAVSQLCPADMHATAQQMVSQLQAHFASGAPAPGWTITPHTAAAGTWYSLEAADIGTIPAILNCGHVATAPKTDLAKLGWDGANPPNLNYAPQLGLYMVRPQFRERGASPAPSPSP
jgi:hypothetical protein